MPVTASSSDILSHCLLEIPVYGTPPSSTSSDGDPASALASFVNDFEFASQAAPLHFVSYAISGAAAVYANSIGRTTDTKSVDALGREIVLKRRRLLSADEGLKVLRAANLLLSVALAQLKTSKALLVLNLSADAQELSLAFSPERRVETFLSALAWSWLPQVSEELRFLLSRLEALILVDAPHSLAESRAILESLLYYAIVFSGTRQDTEKAIRDVQLLSAVSSSCTPPGFSPETDQNNTQCSSIARDVAVRLELYRQHLNGRQGPRLHVSPVGDAYYLKRFVSPPDMPSIYLQHSVRTLEGSKEHRNVLRFLADCLVPAFVSQRLKYSRASRLSDVTVALEPAIETMKSLLTDDKQPSESPAN